MTSVFVMLTVTITGIGQLIVLIIRVALSHSLSVYETNVRKNGSGRDDTGKNRSLEIILLNIT